MAAWTRSKKLALATALVASGGALALVVAAQRAEWSTHSGLFWRLAMIFAIGLPATVLGGWVLHAVLLRRLRPELAAPIGAGVVLVLYIALICMLDINDPVSTVVGLAWQIPLWVGVMLIGAGVARRVGNERLCARCEYPFLEDPTTTRCPECGAGWLGALGTVRGRREANRRLLYVGIGVLAMFVPVFMLGSTHRGLVQRLLPTSVLINQAVQKKGSDDDAWAVLLLRTLSPAQTRALAQGLLDRRAAGDWHWSRDDELWIDGQYRAGLLPPDIAERYIGEIVGLLRLTTLAPGPEDKGVTVRVEADVHHNIRNTQVDVLVVEGWWVDGEFVKTTDTGRVCSTYALEADRTVSGSIDSVRLTVPASDTPVRVRFTGWIAIGPFPTMGWQAAWSAPPGTPGATPTIPGATSLMRRVEVEAVIPPR